MGQEVDISSDYIGPLPFIAWNTFEVSATRADKVLTFEEEALGESLLVYMNVK